MQQYDMICIGNAIVDTLVQVNDGFLVQHALAKGSMSLVDEERALYLFEAITGNMHKVSGGCAANTAAGIASFGGKTGYIGKVRDDDLGAFFTQDLHDMGITYTTAFATTGAKTAICLVFVTPDGERTMATYLGATRNLCYEDIDKDLIWKAKGIYLEGYLWDEPGAIAAMLRAMEIAKGNKKFVSFTLSDPFCVSRHRATFKELIQGTVDILFCNEEEALAMCETDDFNKAVESMQGWCPVVAITRGAKGSVILQEENPGQPVHIQVEPVKKVVDTTGAGDMYAAGFLYAYTQGLPLYECGKYGSLAAASIIQHVGARPKEVFADLVKITKGKKRG